MKKKKEKQSEATKFLERNKIWFTAVIPTFISIGVAGAGIASCQADFKQIELTNLEIEEKNMEKQPFFSIRQDFNEQRNQYIYKIVNTGGEVRYSDIQISPYLDVIHRSEDGRVTNEAFIYILQVFILFLQNIYCNDITCKPLTFYAHRNISSNILQYQEKDDVPGEY